MAVWISIGIAALILVVILKFAPPSIVSLTDRAVASKDPMQLLAGIQKKRLTAQPAAYNHAIRRMWDSYNRDLAITVIRELVKNFGTTPISQYWLKQVLEVEPKLAKKNLGKKFIDTYFLPELAARCGPAG